MTVRRVFLLLVVPLFLLLAGVNGALLFVWERAEAERSLENQAIAAAVSVAAFADSVDDLALSLADPQRAAALGAAAARVEGLHALYVLRADGSVRRLAGEAAAVDAVRPRAPRSPVALPVEVDRTGRRLVTALAPAAGGRVVVAQIDAEPLVVRLAELRRTIAWLVVGSGVIGFVLAWLVARRIARELARTHAMTADPGLEAAAGEAGGFRIRETRDLALAVRLMRASVAGRMARGRHELARRDQARDEAAAVAAHRETALPPLATTAAGVEVAARMLGTALPGSFHALCVKDGCAALVLGECEGPTPSAALARALAARRYCEARLLEGAPEERLDEATRAFAIGRLAWAAWSQGAPQEPGVLALLDSDAGERAAAYGRRAERLAPDAVLDDLQALLDANGVVAALRPAGR